MSVKVLFVVIYISIGRKIQGYLPYALNISSPPTHPDLFCYVLWQPFYFCLIVHCSILSSFKFEVLVFLFVFFQVMNRHKQRKGDQIPFTRFPERLKIVLVLACKRRCVVDCTSKSGRQGVLVFQTSNK